MSSIILSFCHWKFDYSVNIGQLALVRRDNSLRLGHLHAGKSAEHQLKCLLVAFTESQNKSSPATPTRHTAHKGRCADHLQAKYINCRPGCNFKFGLSITIYRKGHTLNRTNTYTCVCTCVWANKL